MEVWKTFIEESSITAELLEKYMELRLYLKELGHTEESIKRISRAPQELWHLKDQFVSLEEKLFRQLLNYGFEVHRPEFRLYLEPKLNNIELLIPLNDGDNERNNSRDEDYQ
jgi:hypothetical protein